MSKNSNNVVHFPKSNTKDIKLEEVQQNLEMLKHYHVQEAITVIAPQIFNQLEIAGFGLTEDEDEDIKDGALIIEAIRSMMLKYYKIYHPFQVLSEEIFSYDEKREGVLKIADSINLELKDPEE